VNFSRWGECSIFGEVFRRHSRIGEEQWSWGDREEGVRRPANGTFLGAVVALACQFRIDTWDRRSWWGLDAMGYSNGSGVEIYDEGPDEGPEGVARCDSTETRRSLCEDHVGMYSCTHVGM
jgi:hypothetical protein